MNLDKLIHQVVLSTFCRQRGKQIPNLMAAEQDYIYISTRVIKNINEFLNCPEIRVWNKKM